MRDHGTTFVGFDGRTGFDDGYDWMAARAGQGWTLQPGWKGVDLGEWPYVCYATKDTRESGGTLRLIEYCEADEHRWSFDNIPEMHTFIDGIVAKAAA